MTNRGRHKNPINSTFRQLRQECANTIIYGCSIRLQNRKNTIYHSYWTNTNVETTIAKIKDCIYSHKVEQIHIKCIIQRLGFFDTKFYTIKLKQ